MRAQPELSGSAKRDHDRSKLNDATAVNFVSQIKVLSRIVQRFALTSLEPAVSACKSLSSKEPIELAVVGQFKSGKSSLLNVVLGDELLPVGVLPVTAVVTRVAAGTRTIVCVTHLDDEVEEIEPVRLADFVTEAGNSQNWRQVSTVDVFTPAMRDFLGIRLVDTPGLGSVFAHDTATTRAWMPHLAVILVAVSADRPLSDEDLQLITDARQSAPRVAIVLTKVDLLTDAEREQVTAFLDRTLHDRLHVHLPVLPFSSRVDTERWLRQLREGILLPVAQNVAREREGALSHKIAHLAKSCREYLSLGLHAAERTESERRHFRNALFDEKVNIDVLRDELRLAEAALCATARPALERLLLDRLPKLQQHINRDLAAELPTWQENLAGQLRRYDAWMSERLIAELTPLCTAAAATASEIVRTAETRYHRGLDAFRDRLCRNILEATGIHVSSPSWEAVQPELPTIPVNVGQTFMIHWDLLWWLLPMTLVGGLFRRHALRRAPEQCEMNLQRLISAWTDTTCQALSDLRSKAEAWVESELATLDRLLRKQFVESAAFRDALHEIAPFVTTASASNPE
ncbi:MAG TPA: dynamin family protein [Lacipirellulaceae bacterium]|nr:dynamin family protein [Lacipirellulaceae bacterium]